MICVLFGTVLLPKHSTQHKTRPAHISIPRSRPQCLQELVAFQQKHASEQHPALQFPYQRQTWAHHPPEGVYSQVMSSIPKLEDQQFHIDIKNIPYLLLLFVNFLPAQGVLSSPFLLDDNPKLLRSIIHVFPAANKAMKYCYVLNYLSPCWITAVV